MDESNQSIVLWEHSYKLEDWMIKEDGSLILHEGEIDREKKVKFIVNSNELTNHHSYG